MDNLQHWLGDFARLFTLQFTSNAGMSDDSTLCECDVEIDHSTRRLNDPYSLRRVSGFLKVSNNLLHVPGLWDEAQGLSLFSVKNRKWNRSQMLLQRQHFLTIFFLKTMGVDPAGV